jgi:nucleoside 2-deoxyribosyltransferase
LIADCTELRQAVFFEAGYAMGLGLPVIFTCKKGTKIEGCFDTRQYNHIIWENAEDLQAQLKDRILAVIGKAQN